MCRPRRLPGRRDSDTGMEARGGALDDPVSLCEFQRAGEGGVFHRRWQEDVKQKVKVSAQ